MTLIKKMLSAITVLSFSSVALYPQDLYDYSHSLKYADYLFNTHQYSIAVPEYERVVFLRPQDTLAKLKLVKSYRYLNEFNKALERIYIFFPRDLTSLPDEFAGEYVKNLLFLDQFDMATAFLQTDKTLENYKKAEYGLCILLMQNQWSDAELFANENSSFLSSSDISSDLNRILNSGLKIKYKKPFLAASLSALFPGSGKIYTTQWKDAIYSFLIITTGSWITYNSWKKNGVNLNTLLAGTVTFGFHAASIYGSAKSANNYNSKINLSGRVEIESLLLDD